MRTLADAKEIVEASLERFLPQPDGDARYAARLFDAMRYSLMSGGKRLRPSLCLYCAWLAGAETETALPFACALDMIHTYSLIHDDLPAMDDDELRRGRPTCHIAFDEATAILAGDGLLSLAFETMLNAAADGAPGKLRAAAYIAAAAGATGMVAGQAADTTYDKAAGERALLEYIQINKTSRMLMASVVSGLLLAGADEAMVRDFERFAVHFGAAFQITDDILDETGDEAVLGKPIGSDERAGKLTAVSVYGIDGAHAQAGRQVELAKAAIAAYPQAAELAGLADSLLTRRF